MQLTITIGLIVSVIVFFVSLVFFSWLSVALSGCSVVLFAVIEQLLESGGIGQ